MVSTTALPSQIRSKHLRACLLCAIIQHPSDFRKMGCPNCEDILQMKRNPERISACTSNSFDGFVAIIDPETSWVSRWLRTSKYVRGVYAATVVGRIPEEVEAALESRGFKYLPRDQMHME